MNDPGPFFGRTNLLVSADNVFKQLSVDFAIVPLLLESDTKHLFGLDLVGNVSGVNLD